MPPDYSAAGLAAAAGVDLVALHRRLASGSPDGIREAGLAFRRAGVAAAEAVVSADSADRAVGVAYQNDGQDVFDAAGSTAETRTALGNGGEQLEEVARAAIEVGDALTTHTSASAGFLRSADSDVAGIIAERNRALVGVVMPPDRLEAADAAFHARAVTVVRAAGTRITGEIDTYDAFVANRTGRLTEWGYRTAPAAPQEDDGFLAAAGDVAAGVVNHAASLGNALLHNPEAAAGLALGAGGVLLGGAGALAGGGIALTGVGTIPGGAVAAGGVALAAAGAASIGLSAAAIHDGATGPDRSTPLDEGAEVDAADTDFDGSGFGREEVEEFINGHTGDGNPALGRPPADAVTEALDRGTRTELGNGTVQYDHTVGGRPVRIYVNPEMPWRSTGFYR